MKWILKVAFIFFVACTAPRNNQNDIRNFLSTIPSKERFLLEYFFRCLIQKDSIGYVLLDGKPMSFYSYFKPKLSLPAFQDTPIKELSLFFEGFDPHEALFEKGLDIWKKYQHLFCGNNIFFDVIEQNRELHYVKVVVINKHLMLDQFERHFQKFKQLGSSLHDKEDIYKALLHNQKLKGRFYSSHELTGICLGYGGKNATLFQKMSSLLTSMKKLGFTVQKPSKERLISLENEYAHLVKSLSSFKDHNSRKFLFNLGVGFRADFTDPETHILQKKYKNLRKTLTHLYNGKDFLEETLRLIILADSSE